MNFANRHQVEEHLAELADGGVIVEIGGGYGNGAIALAHGTARGRKLPIFVVDPYEPYRDELDSEYGPQTLVEFEANLAQTGVRDQVTLVQKSALDAAQDWKHPIALLWIDLTMKMDKLWPIIVAWEPHVIRGGYIAITGLEYNHLGTAPAMAELERRGWQRELVEQRFVAVLRRANDNHSRAAFYIASAGDRGRYVREATLSARSVKEKLGLPTFLFLQGETREDTGVFDRVYPLLAQRGPFWYLDSTRYFNHAIDELAAYEQLLYLDTDTHVCVSCLDIFALLDKFDIALALEPQRDAIESALGVPPSFTTRGIGVVALRNDRRVRDFLADWLERYERDAAIYDNNDQAPLRDALWESDIRFVTLPPEYGLRFDFGAWVVGAVRIIHGRRGGVSTDRESLEDVCKEINSTHKMRIWHHGLLR